MVDESPSGVQLKLLQAALDHINQGFTVFDRELRLVASNRWLFDLFDLPDRLAVPGTHFSEFMRHNAERGEYGEGDVAAMVAERVERARAFRPHYLERIRPNGDVVAIKGEPLPGGGFVTTYTIITDQRLREEALERAVSDRTAALRDSEQRLRLITDAIPALIARIDTDTRYTFANRRYAAWFGHTVDSILGHPVAGVLGDQLHQELGPRIRQALAGEETTYEYRRAGPDGRIAEMRSTLLPDLDESGQVRGCFVLSLDITEQKQREAELQQAQKMEAVGQLTGGVAHDFNNLLTIILGNVNALRARAADHPGLAELVEPVIDAANRGSSLVNRLLAFARGSAGEPRPVDVTATVVDLTRLLRRSMPSSIEVVTQLTDVPRPAKADRSQLENALLNLALNARDAMDGRGHILFTIAETQVEPARATVLGVAPGGYVRIDVGDTGPGMSEEVRRRAFEPFFTTKEFGSGNGLGLSTVYGFARRSSGMVTIASPPGEGATVTLYLPCTEATDQPSDDDSESGERNPATGTGELVLLVEDDTGVRAVVRRQLNDLGYIVLEAEDASEALDMIRSIGEIRYLISDVVMPGQMNGIALANEAKTLTPAIRVGLISGYADGHGVQEIGSSPFPVLAKPFATEALAGLMGRSV
ncbi:MAG: PAS-domain containing protein [Thalassobaculum sp.]|uniref:PAS-domain containing protein n=1 Tax=Thalassobaculum sp. TaxID=2022740 RepID=UPI0032EF97C9